MLSLCGRTHPARWLPARNTGTLGKGLPGRAPAAPGVSRSRRLNRSLPEGARICYLAIASAEPQASSEWTGGRCAIWENTLQVRVQEEDVIAHALCSAGCRHKTRTAAGRRLDTTGPSALPTLCTRLFPLQPAVSWPLRLFVPSSFCDDHCLCLSTDDASLDDLKYVFARP